MTHAVMDRIDWTAAGDEALALLQQLLRMRTVNAPDQNPNETDAASMIAERFRAEGLEPQVIESARNLTFVCMRTVALEPIQNRLGRTSLTSVHFRVQRKIMK